MRGGEVDGEHSIDTPPHQDRLLGLRGVQHGDKICVVDITLKAVAGIAPDAPSPRESTVMTRLNFANRVKVLLKPGYSQRSSVGTPGYVQTTSSGPVPFTW